MKQKNQFEILAIVFAVVVSLLFMAPIYFNADVNYHYYLSNIFAIIVFITFTRWIFLLPHSPFARNNWFRFVMVFLPIPMLMYQIDSLLDFNQFIDEKGATPFFADTINIDNYEFSKYIRYQFTFFSVASLVTIVLLPIRMIRSFWRTVNTSNKV